jgi:hypothetical protein
MKVANFCLAWIATLLVLPTIGACSAYSVPRYAVSANNVTTLRTLRGQSIMVGPFRANDVDSEIMCRGAGPIKTPDGERFSDYVRSAFVSELQMADIYSESAPVTLAGTVDQVDFSSTSGSWELAVTISSSNGKSVRVHETYAFSSSFLADNACLQTAQAFVPAVQDLIAKLVHHPEFNALVSAPDVASPPRPTAEAQAAHTP